MKICTICLQDKHIDDFNKKSTSKDGLQRHCRECSKVNAKKHYYNNRPHEITRIKNRQNEIASKFNEYKSKLCCNCCEETETCCLDFHHRDPSMKDFNISYASRQGYSWERLMEEVGKCLVVCANCHRKIHSGLIDCSQ